MATRVHYSVLSHDNGIVVHGAFAYQVLTESYGERTFTQTLLVAHIWGCSPKPQAQVDLEIEEKCKEQIINLGLKSYQLSGESNATRKAARECLAHCVPLRSEQEDQLLDEELDDLSKSLFPNPEKPDFFIS